jgi:hypothetical protein
MVSGCRFATHDAHAQRTAATHNVSDMSLHMFVAHYSSLEIKLTPVIAAIEGCRHGIS